MPAKPQQRGSHVDTAHQAVVHRARVPAVGEAHDQRNAHAAVIQKLLAAEQRAVVARQHDHRIARQSFVLQTLQQLAHVAVGEMQRIQVVGVLVAGHRTVGIVGAQLQFAGSTSSDFGCCRASVHPPPLCVSMMVM